VQLNYSTFTHVYSAISISRVSSSPPSMHAQHLCSNYTFVFSFELSRMCESITISLHSSLNKRLALSILWVTSRITCIGWVLSMPCKFVLAPTMNDTYHLCMCTISASTAKGSRPLYLIPLLAMIPLLLEIDTLRSLLSKIIILHI